MLQVLFFLLASCSAKPLSVSQIRRHYFGDYSFIYDYVVSNYLTSSDMSGKYAHLKVMEEYNMDDYPFLDP